MNLASDEHLHLLAANEKFAVEEHKRLNAGDGCNEDDSELVVKARKGDREAFGVLVRRYERRVVGAALAVVHNQDDALELAQETFVRAFKNLKNFESRSSFSTWLYRIAANLSIDFWRRERRYNVLCGEEAENELRRQSSGEGDSYRAASQTELADRLKIALQQLSHEQRAVILLREVEALSCEEISETLQCPYGTVVSRLHYARKLLRLTLKDLAPCGRDLPRRRRQYKTRRKPDPQSRAVGSETFD